MAGNELKITITAQDDASQVFKKVSDAASKVADELEKAGKDGGKGFDDLSKSADKAEASLLQLSSSGSGVIRSLNDGASAADEFANRLLQLGSGLQSVGDALDGLGQSALEQQRQIMALDQLYGEASQRYQDFARTIQENTIFSDDQARQAEIYFATLRNNYGVTEEQIQRLVQVSADLATIHGTSLEDAAMRIQSAIRGEAEAAEFLGLTLNQQSIDRENLTLTMSNQEAAQFRLNALWEQTANVTGASTAYVETANGQWQQFKNTMQDTGQSVGSVVGPFGDVFSTLGRGLATVGDATRGIGEIKNGLTGLGGALKATVTGMSSLVAVGGGVALVVGSVAAAVGAGIYLWNEYNTALHSTEEAYKGFDAAQQQFLLNGDTARAAAIEKAKQDLLTFGDWLTEQMSTGVGGPAMPGVYDKTYDEALAAITKALSDSRVDVQEYSTWLQGELRRAYEHPEQAQQIFEGIIATSTNDIGRFAIETDNAASAVKNLTAAQQELNAEMAAYSTILGEDQTPKTAKDVEELNKQVKQTVLLREQLAAAPGQERDLVLARQRIDLLQEEYVTRQQLNDAFQQGDYAKFNELAARRIEQEQMLLDLQREFNSEWTKTAGWQAGAAVGEQLAASTERAAEAARQAVIAFEGGAQALDATASAAEKAAAKVEEINQAQQEVIANWLQLTGNDNFVSQLNLAGLGTTYTHLAEGVNDANTALQDGYRIIVGNTNAIAQNAQQVTDWATELINVEGTYGKIDDLLANNTITLSQYKDAQQAYNSIAADNASIQEDILTIQAKQAPVLAELMAGTQDYVETISTLPPMQQAVALGWMDANEAAKANQILTMAAAAANGELGSKGKEATTAMIQGAVAADPYLKAMLLDMGLISEGADGTITVNFDGAKGANDAIEELTKSIDVLIETLGGIPPIHVDPGDLPQVAAALDATTSAADKAAAAIRGVNQAKGGYTGADVPGSGGYIDSGPVVPVTGQVTEVDTSSAPQAETPATAVVTETDASQVQPVDVPARLSFDMGEAAGGSILNAAQNALGGLNDIKVKVTATADVADAVVGLYNLQTQAETLNGTPITLTATADVGDAVIGLYNLKTQADGFADDTTITFDVEANDNASALIGGIGALAGGLNGYVSTIDMQATDNASALIGGVGALAGALDGYTTTFNLAAVDGASATIGGVGAFAGQLDGFTTHFILEAVDNASGIIGAVGALAGGLDGYTSTITMNVVTQYSTVGMPPGTNAVARHGGIPEYATGGVLFRGGEAGPEIAHFAGGGMAILPYDGLYLGPQGTRIEPANSAASKLGRGPLVHIENITIGAGADPSSAQAIVSEIITRLDRALEHRDRAGGLVA